MKTSAKTALALLASVLLPATAMAAAGQAEPWQIGLQDAASPVSEYIHWFHNMLLVSPATQPQDVRRLLESFDACAQELTR